MLNVMTPIFNNLVGLIFCYKNDRLTNWHFRKSWITTLSYTQREFLIDQKFKNFKS